MIAMHARKFLFSTACAALLLCGALPLPAQDAIESGEWAQNTLWAEWWYGWWFQEDISDTYNFYAQDGETVIIRIGHDKDQVYPLFEIYNPGPDGNISTNSKATYTKASVSEYYMQVTNSGWYHFECSLPSPVITNVYTNLTTSYNCSMLRIPHVPLSYQDPEVGTLVIGDSKVGKIDVSSDLDAGFFSVSGPRTTMQIRMGQMNYPLVPNIQVYDPNGLRVTNDFPTDYRSEITATLTNPGIYTVVCSDKFNAKGSYALTMVQIPGEIAGSDPDFGAIISGETRSGTIHQPGDLDVAYFNAVSGDVVSVVMHDVDVDMNPVLELYGPEGQRLAATMDVFEVSAVISNFAIVSNGVYSLVCKDKEDRFNVSYTLVFNFMPGSPSIQNLPEPPSALSATQGTYSNKIEVTWSAAGGATGYDIFRSYGTNSSAWIWTNQQSLSYQDYDVEPGTHYFYKIRSRNTYGASTNFSATAEGYAGASVVSAGRKVLMVGIDNYSPSYGASALATCTNDVYGMRNIFFLGDASNLWASTNMTLYTDRQATKATVRAALHSLASASSAGDLVVYVHSSHGGTYGGYDTFICTYDADFTDAELAADLALFNSDAKIIIIIDACYSGGMFKLKPGESPPPWRFAENTMGHFKRIKAAQLRAKGIEPAKQLGDNIAFMTACDYNELSYCSDFYSRYIGYLIAGCNIQSVDTNSSGMYDFLELHSYAAAESMAETPTQHAQSYHPALLNETIARAVGTNASILTHIKYNDFDGDAFSDLAIYSPASGTWRIGSIHRWAVLGWDVPWGAPGCLPVNGDYDGDRTTDCALYNQAQGVWSIASLSRYAVLYPALSFGGPSFGPVCGDYTGDGLYDFAVYRYPEGFWYVASSSGTPLVWGSSIGGIGFTPVSGDYNGDRVSDLAMYHPEQGSWYIVSPSGTNIAWGAHWGGSGYEPVSGDYDGDGFSDLAVYSHGTGLWHIWSLKRSAIIADAIPFGGAGFTPVPGDYNGDGACDLVVYQESTGNWYLRTVSGSVSAMLTFGGPGYVPVLPSW